MYIDKYGLVASIHHRGHAECVIESIYLFIVTGVDAWGSGAGSS
jgi:hypothetical protein